MTSIKEIMKPWFTILLFDDVLIPDHNTIYSNPYYQQYIKNKIQLFSYGHSFFDNVNVTHYLQHKRNLNELDSELFKINVSHRVDKHITTSYHEIPVYIEVCLNINHIRYLINEHISIPNYSILCALLKDRYDLTSNKMTLTKLVLTKNRQDTSITIEELLKKITQSLDSLYVNENDELVKDNFITTNNGVYFDINSNLFVLALTYYDHFKFKIHKKVIIFTEELLVSHFNTIYTQKHTYTDDRVYDDTYNETTNNSPFIFINITDWEKMDRVSRIDLYRQCIEYETMNTKYGSIKNDLINYYDGLTRKLCHFLNCPPYTNYLEEYQTLPLPTVNLLKPSIFFYKEYNSYVNHPKNSELDSQLLHYVGAYRFISFIHQFITIDKKFEKDSGNDCPICYKKCKDELFCMTSCQHVICHPCIQKLFNSSSFYHTIYPDQFNTSTILNDNVVHIPKYNDVINNDYKLKEETFYNNTYLSISCPICRNIVPDTYIYLLTKKNYTRNKTYFNALRTIIVKNKYLDYKTQCVINELFSLRIKTKTTTNVPIEILNNKIGGIKGDIVNTSHKIHLYISESNLWNKYIQTISNFLFKDTNYRIIALSFMTDLNTDYKNMLCTSLMTKYIDSIHIHFIQNYNFDQSTVDSYMKILYFKLIVLKYINRIKHQSINSHQYTLTKCDTTNNNTTNNTPVHNTDSPIPKSSNNDTLHKNQHDQTTNTIQPTSSSIYNLGFNKTNQVYYNSKINSNTNITSSYHIIKNTVDYKLFNNEIILLKKSISQYYHNNQYY